MTDWRNIVSRHGPAVWRTAYRLLGAHADAADCFQEAFLAALQMSRRQRVRSWPALLQTLTTRRALDELRRRIRRRDGEVFALLMTVYPVTRILIELIRTDEPSQFHTQLTISQLISIAILVSLIGFWTYLLKQPRGSVLPFRAGDDHPKGATSP